jgi:acetylornithine/succinyldiaminopimelate/putrescine aminotransferase/ubiquinone/menaquinone biosynthesis C-methylase UbiE
MKMKQSYKNEVFCPAGEDILQLSRELLRPASEDTLQLMKELNQSKKNTFLLPTGFISPEAGQVGFLLNEYFNLGRKSHEHVYYKTFFGNSRYEALHGAIKIARAHSLLSFQRNKREILICDPSQQLKLAVDPLNRGIEKALIPGVMFFEKTADVAACISEMAYPPSAVIVRAHENLSLESVDELFCFCRERGVTRILDESDSDVASFPNPVNQVSLLPDVIIVGESLTEYEIPFGAFSSANEIYMPLNFPHTCMVHTSTCGGNRLALTRVREYLLANVPFLTKHSFIISQCRKIEENDEQRIKFYNRFVNPSLAQVYAQAGLDINPIKANGSIFTIKENGREKEVLDLAAGGGVAVRGHTPADIVSEVLDAHDIKEDYWEKLCQLLNKLTGFPHAFPAVSGSTAVEIGITLALLANKDKTRVIIFKGNYAGATLVSLVGTEDESLRTPFFPLYYDVLYIDPFSKRAKDVLAKELQTQQVALVWFEVFQGQLSRGVPQELLELVELYKKEGGYLVGIDESLTGIYRVGTFVSYDQKMSPPDIVVLFKALTDATFPIAVTLSSLDVYQRALTANPKVVQFYQGLYRNQLGSHIALHLLGKVTNSDLEKNVKKISVILKTGLEEIAKKSPFINEVHGEGLLYHIDYNLESKIFRLFGKAGKVLGPNLLPLFISRLFLNKVDVFVYLNRFGPALSITEQQVHSFINRLRKVLIKKPGKYFTYLSFLVYLDKEIRALKRTAGKSFFNKLKSAFSYFARIFAVDSVSDYYTRLGDDLIETLNTGFTDPSKSLWHNNGYWKTEKIYRKACAAMAKLLGESAALGPDDHILDVGFGYGEQDLYWVDTFNVGRIVGINVTPLQVEVARNRVKEQGLEDRIELHSGTAINIQFDDESFDKVLSLECAFHFDTREKFFEEAFRVLRPGGILAVTDMLPSPGAKTSGFFKRLERKHACVPEMNMYDRDIYADKLRNAGFINISIQSITEYVYPGSAKYLIMRRVKKLDMESTVVQLSEKEINEIAGVEIWEKSAGISVYILCTAEKP